MILTKSIRMLPFKWHILGVSPWLLLAIGKVQAQAQLRFRIHLSLAAPGLGIKDEWISDGAGQLVGLIINQI